MDTEGNFICLITIQESPLEPGMFLLPPNAIPLVPNKNKIDTHDIYWDGDKFNYTVKEIPVVYEDTEPEMTPQQELSELKIRKILETTSIVNDIIAVYTYDYSEPEKLSWSKQEEEALSLLSDEDAPAPFIRQLAVVRDMDVLMLRDKILGNVENYSFLSALLIGTQQKYSDLINSYTVDTMDELRELKIVFPV